MAGSNWLLLVYIGVAWVAINIVFLVVKPSRIELVSPLHIRVTTQRLNRPIHTLASLSIVRTPLGTRITNMFYDLGICVALVGMLACLVLLVVASMQIALSLSARLGAVSQILHALAAIVFGAADQADSPPTQRSLQKRMPISDGKNRQLLQPVIPGVTLPLSHIWYYLLSLAICAIVHELGHALAAAWSYIPLRRFGVFIMGIYPGAFVDLSKDDMDKAPVLQQLRVVCAGVWHNAVTAMLVYLLVYSGGLSRSFEFAGWQKIDGVAIMDIEHTSPLFGRIPVLSTIYRIDDVDLSGKSGPSPIARWTRALTATQTNQDTAESGFCVTSEENVDDGLCCEMSPQYPMGESPDTDIFCFEPYRSPNATSKIAKRSRVLLLDPAEPPSRSTMCFDLRDVLERTGQHRCRSSSECPGRHAACVLPRSPYQSSRVARIYYTKPDMTNEMTIYVGSLSQLWLDVHASSLVPRHSWLPQHIPSWTESLLQYVLSFSIALCLLNAIPAWYLDGDHALRLVLAAIEGKTDAEAAVVLGKTGERVHKIVTACTTVLLGWCIAGSILVLIL